MTAELLIHAAAACVTCGKEHELRKIGTFKQTWAARDGHSYRPRIFVLTGQSAAPIINALRQLCQDAES